MDTVSNSKKLQATKSIDQKIHFINNPIFHSLLVVTYGLLCFYRNCFSDMKHFMFLSLPNIFFSLSTPKWLFIVVNIIVAFLIGESKFVGSHSSPAGEIYDEYVERSTSLRSSSSTLHGKAEGSKVDLEFDEEIKSTDDVLHVEEVKLEDKEVIEIPKEEEKYQVTEVEDIEEEEEEAEEEKDEEEEEEIGLPAEELNRRVEEFIARVNKQRWLEARS